jgi:hypothetical protein
MNLTMPLLTIATEVLAWRRSGPHILRLWAALVKHHGGMGWRTCGRTASFAANGSHKPEDADGLRELDFATSGASRWHFIELRPAWNVSRL